MVLPQFQEALTSPFCTLYWAPSVSVPPPLMHHASPDEQENVVNVSTAIEGIHYPREIEDFLWHEATPDKRIRASVHALLRGTHISVYTNAENAASVSDALRKFAASRGKGILSEPQQRSAEARNGTGS